MQNELGLSLTKEEGWWCEQKLLESQPNVQTKRELGFVVIVYVFKDGQRYLEMLNNVSMVYTPSIIDYRGL